MPYDGYGSELAVEQMITDSIAEMEDSTRLNNKEWKMANGEVVKIKHMEESHIINCINLMKRQKWDRAEILTDMLNTELEDRRLCRRL